ncbi:MAG: hypothetical protein FJ108_13915 [Deltaproteobacteria bacterium]|nr:hypothetical protein [Deltaproteobacteria bacterium]
MFEPPSSSSRVASWYPDSSARFAKTPNTTIRPPARHQRVASRSVDAWPPTVSITTSGSAARTQAFTSSSASGTRPSCRAASRCWGCRAVIATSSAMSRASIPDSSPIAPAPSTSTRLSAASRASETPRTQTASGSAKDASRGDTDGCTRWSA